MLADKPSEQTPADEVSHKARMRNVVRGQFNEA